MIPIRLDEVCDSCKNQYNDDACRSAQENGECPLYEEELAE